MSEQAKCPGCGHAWNDEDYHAYYDGWQRTDKCYEAELATERAAREKAEAACAEMHQFIEQVVGRTGAFDSPGQSILDRVKELEAFVSRIDGGSIPDMGGNTPSQMVAWVQSIRASARKLLKGEGE